MNVPVGVNYIGSGGALYIACLLKSLYDIAVCCGTTILALGIWVLLYRCFAFSAGRKKSAWGQRAAILSTDLYQLQVYSVRTCNADGRMRIAG